MTEIIAGKLDESTFMMADCISQSIPNKKGLYQLLDDLPLNISQWEYLSSKYKRNKFQANFTNKINKLESSENTYFTSTGKGFLLNCILTLDAWYASRPLKVQNDFCQGEESLGQLIQVIYRSLESCPIHNLQLGQNRLVFINSSAVVYYDFVFDNKNRLYNKPSREKLESGYFVDSIISFPPEQIIMSDFKDIYEFCKYHLDKTINGDGIDFKNRFAFVKLKAGEQPFILSPYMAISDIIAFYNQYPFNSIDDIDFFWNL